MGTQGYRSSNLSDEVKHSNLEIMTRLMIDRTNPNYVHYYELHSGAGRYQVNGQVHDGSAIRVLKILREEIVVHEAFLHERNPKLRSELEKNVKPYVENGNVHIFEDWKDEIENHLNLRRYESIFMLDPTHLSAYTEDDGLLIWLGLIMSKGTAVFMYAPQNVHPEFKDGDKHARTIKKIRWIIKHWKRRGIDLMHFAGRGYHQRIDHNIIVAEPAILQELKKTHKERCEELGALRKGYPSFREIRP